MGDKTGISWTDATWNPTRGCSRVSAGCQHCYAEVQAARIVRMGKGKPTAYDGLVKVRSKVSGLWYRDLKAAGDYTDPRWTGEVRLVPEQLAWPLSKRKPLRIFVNSMSDLFHEKLTNEQIAAAFGVMAACPQHTFQVLTKRAKRMLEWFEWLDDAIEERAERIMGADCACSIHDARDAARIDFLVDAARDAMPGHHKGYIVRLGHEEPLLTKWPMPNVWIGVSVENQEAADERIPKLMCTPAAVRFLSCEPLLGPIDLTMAFADATCRRGGFWVIAGCESGPGARACKADWLRTLRDQCAAAGVRYFLKQATQDGNECDDEEGACTVLPGPGSKTKPGGVIELPYLDGRQHAEFPDV